MNNGLNGRFLWERLSDNEKPVVLYGTGNGADVLLEELARRSIPVYGIFASDEFARGQTFGGFTVKKYSDFEEELGEFTILLAFGSDRPEVRENILALSRRQELFVPDIPVRGGEIFTREYASAHSDELLKAYELLEDERSRRVFEDIVKFRLTGELGLLLDSENDRSEKLSLLAINGDESFLDLGAYDGDTVMEFIGSSGGYRKITAVEADAKNFSRLRERMRTLEGITLLNVCVSGHDGRVSFSAKHGRGSSVRPGAEEVDCFTLDTLFPSENFSVIKCDIEGQELAMLTGAKGVITRCRPKMMISCYHGAEDIFKIPLMLKTYVPQYKIYLRRERSIPAWDADIIAVI